MMIILCRCVFISLQRDIRIVRSSSEISSHLFRCSMWSVSTHARTHLCHSQPSTFTRKHINQQILHLNPFAFLIQITTDFYNCFSPSNYWLMTTFYVFIHSSFIVCFLYLRSYIFMFARGLSMFVCVSLHVFLWVYLCLHSDFEITGTLFPASWPIFLCVCEV